MGIETEPMQRASIILLAVVLVLVGLYDLWAALFRGSGATVSVVVLMLSRRYPVLPFLMGLLFGHLIWPQYPAD